MKPTSTDAVAWSEAALDVRAAARDLWPGGTLERWTGGELPVPERVWWPDSDAQVAAVLKAASEQGRVVVPYGAGSGVCGGARGRVGAWVLDTKRFASIGEVDREHWTVEVEAGVNGQHLEDALNAQGFTLGHSPSSIWCSTVGGWAAARSAGQFSSRYGVFEDMVLGLDVVSPAGGPFYVGLAGEQSSERRGPDGWMALLIGSEGTLGVVTRLRLRVRPLAETRWLRGYAFESLAEALEVMRALMQAELWPAVVRLYDPVDTLVGGRTKPKSDRVKTQAWWASWLKQVDDFSPLRKRMLALPLALPSLLQSVGDRLAGRCLLILGWEGAPDVVEACSSVGHEIACRKGTDLGTAPGERWYDSRHAVSYKLMPIFERGGFADTMEVAARWSQLPVVYAAVRGALREHVVVMAHMSHLYPEGGSIYFSFAGRGDRAVYDAAWASALEAVLAAGGTVTHHHGVGTLKAAAVSREVGPAVQGWQALKRELDPAQVMNPGRVFVDVPNLEAPPSRCDAPQDGLAWVSAHAGHEEQLAAAPEGTEPRWHWAKLPGPPSWRREPWQTTWVEVRGDVDGRPVALGRGPRSASGSDLRAWVVEQDEDAVASIAVGSTSSSWMGAVELEHPWALAQQLLRADLRPAVLGVEGDRLYVGFRGPAAVAMGELASRQVPGGLRKVPWHAVSRAAGVELEVAEVEDPAVVAVTTEYAWRPVTGEAS